MRFRHTLLAFIPVILCLFLSGCILRPYRINIQQGNIITPAMAKSVRRGMTRSDVENILGKPVLINVFNNNSLIYVYTFKPGYGPMQDKRMVIHFRGDRVSSYSLTNNTYKIPASHNKKFI